jgi:hypothetical protein
MPQTQFPWTGGEAPTFAEIREKPTTYPATPATTTVEGGVLEMPHQAHTVAADLTALKVDFNLLLDKLVAAGIMSAT